MAKATAAGEHTVETAGKAAARVAARVQNARHSHHSRCQLNRNRIPILGLHHRSCRRLSTSGPGIHCCTRRASQAVVDWVMVAADSTTLSWPYVLQAAYDLLRSNSDRPTRICTFAGVYTHAMSRIPTPEAASTYSFTVPKSNICHAACQVCGPAPRKLQHGACVLPAKQSGPAAAARYDAAGGGSGIPI